MKTTFAKCTVLGILTHIISIHPQQQSREVEITIFAFTKRKLGLKVIDYFAQGHPSNKPRC